MKKHAFIIRTGSLILAASTAAMVQAAIAAPTHLQSATTLQSSSDSTKAMQDLQRAAQMLRDSIQTLAQQPVGEARKTALEDAHKALFDTNQAMVRLPPEYRDASVVASGGSTYRSPDHQSYQQTVKDLRKASDRLYEAIHAMAKEPAGPRRNDAIKEANAALIQTQGAMAWAYENRLAAGSHGNNKMTSGTTGAYGSTSSSAGGVATSSSGVSH